MSAAVALGFWGIVAGLVIAGVTRDMLRARRLRREPPAFNLQRTAQAKAEPEDWGEWAWHEPPFIARTEEELERLLNYVPASPRRRRLV